MTKNALHCKMGSIIYKYLSDFRYSTDFYYVDISPRSVNRTTQH